MTSDLFRWDHWRRHFSSRRDTMSRHDREPTVGDANFTFPPIPHEARHTRIARPETPTAVPHPTDS